jgi:DNA-binding PadR family transcriptional regulator
MPKRRRVSNLLGLAVLSALVEKPMHPYEMATLLRERGKDQDMPIKWGSLYTVVGNLEKHGLVRASGVDRQGARPERTVYALTDEGRAELEDWVRELISEPVIELPRFKAGLSVLALLGPDEAITLLRRRLVGLDERLATQRAQLARFSPELPRLFLIEAEYDLALCAAEVDWVRSLLHELTTGEFPGLHQWQAWFEQGGPPFDGAADSEGSP